MAVLSAYTRVALLLVLSTNLAFIAAQDGADPSPVYAANPSSPWTSISSDHLKELQYTTREVMTHLSKAAGLTQVAAVLLKQESCHLRLLASGQALQNAAILLRQREKDLIVGQIDNALATIGKVRGSLEPAFHRPAMDYLDGALRVADAARCSFVDRRKRRFA
ncbi:hypothetical protein CLOM_g22832 [Closterium sp. NIES-68]|nr:hypothetical protein CLOM_g22832 [Closterium sp. NIES-68]GJP82607.1 hypothetical protein CLOP_g12845 [Closterium sp. NIES-67]